MAAPHYELVARQLIRAVRGRRSQSDLSRRANYRSNMVQRWEAGECSPTAARFLEICAVQRIDVAAAIRGFYGREPEWLRAHAADTPAVVARFLDDQRGKVTIAALAIRSGHTRFRLARWFSGKAEPRLPDFLELLEVCSQRLLDFVAQLVSPANVPALRSEWIQLEKARATAYDFPWSHAVLRVLELDEYQRSARPTSWLAQRLGCEERAVEEALHALGETGQVTWEGSRHVVQVGNVNTGRDPDRAPALKSFWSQTATARLESGHPGLFGYNLFSVSRDALRRIRELQLEYVRAMEDVVEQDASKECVALYCVQLLDLDSGPENSLSRISFVRGRPSRGD